MKALIEKLTATWATLDRRERLIVTGGAGLLLVLFFWLLVWEPLAGSVTRLENDKRALTETRIWMQQAVQEAQALKARAGTAGRIPPGQSLLAVLDQTAQAAQIKGSVKRMEPRGDRSVQMQIDSVPFNALILWLGQIGKQHGIAPTHASLERTDAPGVINAKLTLETSAP